MTRNGETVLKELIAASNGKYNPFHIFSSKELEIATNNYDNRTVVEQDGFRTSYKSYWKQERSISVMKFDDNDNYNAYECCISNVVYRSQISHKHILKLIGCCLETELPILVFESAEYGTLADRLHCRGDHFEALSMTDG